MAPKRPLLLNQCESAFWRSPPRGGVSTHTYTHTCACAHTYKHKRVREYTQVRTYTYTCAHTNTQTHARAHIHTHKHTGTQAHTHMCTHTHTHAHMHMRAHVERVMGFANFSVLLTTLPHFSFSADYFSVSLKHVVYFLIIRACMNKFNSAYLKFSTLQLVIERRHEFPCEGFLRYYLLGIKVAHFPP